MPVETLPTFLHPLSLALNAYDPHLSASELDMIRAESLSFLTSDASERNFPTHGTMLAKKG